LNLYGDQLLFEYKITVDQGAEKATIDSKFSAQAEVRTDGKIIF